MNTLGLDRVDNIEIRPREIVPQIPQEIHPIPHDSYDQLNHLFQEQGQQQKDIQEARAILGESAERLTDSQVYDLVTEIQFLVDSWLEEYEKNVFEGKTLDEVLGG